LFPIDNLQVYCVFDRVITKEKNLIKNSTATVDELNHMEPKSTGWYVCPFRAYLRPNEQIVVAVIHFAFAYDSPLSFGSRTLSASEEYTLDTASVPATWLTGNHLK